EQHEHGGATARNWKQFEAVSTQNSTQSHKKWEFRAGKLGESGPVDSFSRKVLRSPSPFCRRSGEIGIRSRLKICRDLVPWGFKSPLRHAAIYYLEVTDETFDIGSSRHSDGFGPGVRAIAGGH